MTALFFVVPARAVWLLLLVASCAFYMAFIPVYVLILLFTILVDYTAGLLIERSTGPRRKTWLVASIVTNVGVLAVFKYYNFFVHSLEDAAHGLGMSATLPALTWILPIGLSFHTFQAMSYTLEVYRGNQKAEHHLGIYALYVMFYPQLVAGPIERPQNLLPQFRAFQLSPRWNDANVVYGLRLMLWGLFKKCVVADRLSPVVDRVYGQPEAFGSVAHALATVFFAFQIYADFSGYSDIALGAARVMNIKLMTNFRQPYLAVSVSDFWRRWHVSLSTWFKDYVYVPLGGSRHGMARTNLNLLLTFMVSGLWHGANWTFVVWGALNGMLLVLENGLRRAASRWSALTWLVAESGVWAQVARVRTFALVCCTWVFFRAETVQDGFFILGSVVAHAPDLFSVHAIREALVSVQMSRHDVALIFALVGCTMLYDIIAERSDPVMSVEGLPRWARWCAYYAVAGAVTFLGVFGGQQFIYFQF
ncbi:MAG: MBOAT family O-acyltransferase [Myxococcota bacterium]